VSELCQSSICDPREYSPGIIGASVIDHDDEIDEVWNSFDCSLDVILFVVDWHNNCHAFVAVHLLSCAV
jgi:hypothetical protein